MRSVHEAVVDALQKTAGLNDGDPMLAKIKSDMDLELGSLGLDSLSLFEALMQLEEEFDIEIDQDDISQNSTIKQLTDYISASTKAA